MWLHPLKEPSENEWAALLRMPTLNWDSASEFGLIVEWHCSLEAIHTCLLANALKRSANANANVQSIWKVSTFDTFCCSTVIYLSIYLGGSSHSTAEFQSGSYSPHVQSSEFPTDGLQFSCRDISRTICGSSMQLCSVPSLMASLFGTLTPERHRGLHKVRH